MAQVSKAFLFLVLTLLTGLPPERAMAAAPDLSRHESFRFDDRERSYTLHLPPGLGKRPVALVVALHGGGGNGDLNAEQTGFDALADREGFIVVHPDGSGPPRPLLNALGKGRLYTWNAGSCCGYAVQQRIDDVGFLRTLVLDLRQRYPIDPKRIYATGLSNGGMMAYRLASEAGDLFAAIAVVSGVQTSATGPADGDAVSILHIHGSADRNVPLLGGIGDKAADRNPKPPVLDAIRYWVRRNGTAPDPQRSEQGEVLTDTWQGGRNGSSVQLSVIRGGGHAWPGGRRLFDFLDEPSQALSATEVIWDFFQAHPKR